MKAQRIELVYLEGCPNAAEARDNIRVAVEASGRPLEWSEWDLMAESTPADFRRYGSPTVLIDGQDVTGADAGALAMACRADGAPSVASIAERLR